MRRGQKHESNINKKQTWRVGCAEVQDTVHHGQIVLELFALQAVGLANEVSPEGGLAPSGRRRRAGGGRREAGLSILDIGRGRGGRRGGPVSGLGTGLGTRDMLSTGGGWGLRRKSRPGERRGRRTRVARRPGKRPRASTGRKRNRHSSELELPGRGLNLCTSDLVITRRGH